MNLSIPDPNGDIYHPVSCEFHDVLEAAAVLRKQVPVVVRAADGTTSTRTARITDVYARDGADYMTLDSGETIRLDALAAVDGVPAAPAEQGDGNGN